MKNGFVISNNKKMRPILFKGKRVHCDMLPKDKWWVEGDVSFHKTGKVFIKERNGSALHSYEIDPNTLSQYVCQDIESNPIFEHDLCVIDVVDEDDIFETLWDEKNARYILKGEHSQYNFVTSYGSDFEVVGNVFDKQEIQKDVKRTLFVGDKSKEEIADWLESNAKLGTIYATFGDGSKATILMFQNGQETEIHFPDGVRIIDASLDEVAEKLVEVSFSKEVEEEMEM